MAKGKKSGKQEDTTTKRILLLTALTNLITALLVLIKHLTG